VADPSKVAFAGSAGVGERLGEGTERPAGKGEEGGSGGERQRQGAGESRVEGSRVEGSRVEGKERKQLKSASAHEVVNIDHTRRGIHVYEEEDTCICS